MTKTILIIAFSILLFGCSILGGSKELHYIGFVNRDCTINISESTDDKIISVFNVSPDDAAKVIPDGCRVKFPYSIYVDEKYYYFYDTNESSSAFTNRNDLSVKEHSYVVDADTGEMISIPKLKR
jgi:hypothetical protein